VKGEEEAEEKGDSEGEGEGLQEGASFFQQETQELLRRLESSSSAEGEDENLEENLEESLEENLEESLVKKCTDKSVKIAKYYETTQEGLLPKPYLVGTTSKSGTPQHIPMSKKWYKAENLTEPRKFSNDATAEWNKIDNDNKFSAKVYKQRLNTEKCTYPPGLAPDTFKAKYWTRKMWKSVEVKDPDHRRRRSGPRHRRRRIWKMKFVAEGEKVGHVWQGCQDTLKRFQIYNAFDQDVRLKFYKHNDGIWTWFSSVSFMDVVLKNGTYLTVDLTNGCAIYKKAYDVVEECKKDPASAGDCENKYPGSMSRSGDKRGLGETRVNSVSCKKDGSSWYARYDNEMKWIDWAVDRSGKRCTCPKMKSYYHIYRASKTSANCYPCPGKSSCNVCSQLIYKGSAQSRMWQAYPGVAKLKVSRFTHGGTTSTEYFEKSKPNSLKMRIWIKNTCNKWKEVTSQRQKAMYKGRYYEIKPR